MRNILITGGAGYVGSQTCKTFKSHGYNPISFDNIEYGHEYAVQWGDLIKGDLRNITEIDAALKKTKPIAVVHCAASTYVGESVTNPYKYYHNNVYGSLNLFKTMIDNNIKNLIFSSTCATYGEVEPPLLENSPQNPINPYGSSKLMVEKILKDFDTAYNLKTIMVRYFNVAGADSEGKVGEDHNPETHLIPLIIDVALGKRANIKVFGTTYATKDGTCIRDYIHTEDLAHAHFLALEYLLKNQISNDFNLGSGYGYSVLEIIEAVKKVSTKEIPMVLEKKRMGDPAILLASPKKAKQILGWEAKHDIHTIVETAYNWHKKQQNKK